MVPQASDKRQTLRRATHAAHRRLDALIDTAGMLASRARYTQFLQASWAARSTVEAALEQSGIVALYAAWPARRLRPSLLADLADMSATPPASLQTDEPPHPLSAAQSLGVLYVLEGSALGAAVLAKRAAAIGMTAQFGARHLAHQTSVPGAWAAFTALLACTPMTRQDQDSCVAAALSTFTQYEQAFGSQHPSA